MFDAYSFGYTLNQRSDGGFELIDPPFIVTGAVLMFLAIPGLFIAIGILTSLSLLGVQMPWFHIQPANWFMAALSLVIGGAAFTFGAQVFLRRSWIIDSASVIRRADIKRTPFGWHRSYQLGRLEILHEVWDDESGVSDSVIGWLSDKRGKPLIFEYFDFPIHGPVHGRTGGWLHPKGGVHRPKLLPRLPTATDSVPDGDEVAPRVWWLGHKLCKLTGLPLNVQARVRKAPDLSGA